MAATSTANQAVVIPKDTILQPVESFDTITYPGADTVITKTEYRRLRLRDDLAEQASGLFTDLQIQLRDCEQSRVKLHQLQTSTSLQLLQGLSDQKDLLTNRPIILQPCPPAVKPRKTWPIWLLGVGGTIGGIILGTKL